MTSTSAQGSTTITLQFALDRNIDAAARDVQSAIAAALRRLPPNMPAPPSFRKVNPADSPISTSRCRHRPCRCRWSMNTPKPSWPNANRPFPGVARCRSTVRRNRAVRVRPTRTSWRRSIGIDELQQAIAQGNVNQPVGQLDGSRQTFALKDKRPAQQRRRHRPLIVTWRNGAPGPPGRRGDADRQRREHPHRQLEREQARHRARRAAPAGANTIETVDAIKRILPHFRPSCRRRWNMNILFDRSNSIRPPSTMCSSPGAVGCWSSWSSLFLRNLSATVIPSLALPISVVGTFAAMSVLGYSLDNLSLLA